MTILSIKAEKINTKVVKTTSNNYIHFLIPSSFIKAVRTEKVDVSSFNLLGLSKDVRIESSLDVNLYNKASDLLTVTTTKEGVNKKGEEIGEIKLSLNSIIYIVETNNGVEVCVLLPNGSRASIVSYIISETIEELITQIESDLIGSGGGGGIESIVAGDNITVDNTDPLNPIVSASGGGSSALFPNGVEFVSASRDFQLSDKGKNLVVVDGVNLTMPEINPFSEGDNVLISTYTNTSVGNSVTLVNGDNPTLLLAGENYFLTNVDMEGTIFAITPASSNIGDKTILKYLYDKSQNAIPLSGTEVGSPVTGDIEFSDNSTLYQGTDEATKLSIQFKSGQIEQKAKDNTTGSDITVTTNPLAHDILVNDVTTGYAGFLNVSADGIHINSSNPESSGLFAGVDFTANAKNNPNAYVQYAGLSALRFVISKSQSVSDGDFDAYAGTAYILPEVASNDKVINLQTAQDGDIYRFVNVAQPTNNWITSVLFFLSDGTSSNTVPAEKITVIQYDAAASVFHLISSQ